MSESKTVAGAYAKIEAHEELCAERYENIHAALGDLKTDGKEQRKVQWGVLVALLGFMALQLWNNNNARLSALEKPPAVVVQNQQGPRP